MKLEKLREEVAKRGRNPDKVAPLHNGKKVTSQDYIRSIQQWEIDRLGGYNSLSWGLHQRLKIDTPMLCHSYTALKPHEQEECMNSDDWIAERKLDGVRMLTTYHPDEGFAFFSRNLSVKNFLPVEYTDIILINYNGSSLKAKDTVGLFSNPFILDTEATSKTSVIDTTRYKKGGTVTNSRLNAICTTISDKTNSHSIQQDQCEVTIIAFDCLYIFNDKKNLPLKQRLVIRKELVRNLEKAGFNNITEADYAREGKQQFYDELVAAGEEGVVLKNLYSPYLSDGKRSKRGFVKRKRTVAESLGRDIDAYVVGFSPSNEKNKLAHLIGGLVLAVSLQKQDGSEEEFTIATVAGISLELREKMTITVNGKPALRDEYLGKVLVIDGQDISPKSRQFRHARADWDRGFRDDKSYLDCKLTEEFLNSQIF